MTNEKTKPYASTVSTSSSLDLEKLKTTVKEFEQKELSIIRNLISGIPCIEDSTGMVVHPNGYVVVLGSKLFKRLKDSYEND